MSHFKVYCFYTVIHAIERYIYYYYRLIIALILNIFNGESLDLEKIPRRHDESLQVIE